MPSRSATIQGAAAWRLDVRSERAVHAVGKLFGLQDLPRGDHELDRELLVQASDASACEAAVKAGLAAALAQLASIIRERDEGRTSSLPARHSRAALGKGAAFGRGVGVAASGGGEVMLLPFGSSI